MNIAMRRASFAAASLLMAAIGFTSLFMSVDGTGARNEFIIQVNESGFNPPSCTVNKGTTLRWLNVGQEVHRVVRPDVGVQVPPLFDTGDLQPGDLSKRFELTIRDTWDYEDFYNPELKGRVNIPNATSAESCDLQPPTATPTLTPTPTPTPDPGRAFIPGVSRGEQPATPTPTPSPTATPDPDPE